VPFLGSECKEAGERGSVREVCPDSVVIPKRGEVKWRVGMGGFERRRSEMGLRRGCVSLPPVVEKKDIDPIDGVVLIKSRCLQLVSVSFFSGKEGDFIRG